MEKKKSYLKNLGGLIKVKDVTEEGEKNYNLKF